MAGLVVAGWLIVSEHGSRQGARRSDGAGASCSSRHGRRRRHGRAGAAARHRHRPGLQHSHYQEPRRRPDRHRRLHRRSVRQGRPPAYPDRPRAVAGGARSRRSRPNRKTRRSSPAPAGPRPLRQADRLRATSRARPTTSSRPRRCTEGHHQGRPGEHRSRQGQSRALRHPRPDRRPARRSSWSMSATCVRANQAPPLVTVAQLKPILVTFTLPQDVASAICAKQASGASRGPGLWRRQQDAARHRQTHPDRQPDRPDDRHDPSQGRPSTMPTSGCGRASSSMCASVLDMRMRCRHRARSARPCRAPNGHYAYIVWIRTTPCERRPVDVASVQDGLAVIAKGMRQRRQGRGRRPIPAHPGFPGQDRSASPPAPAAATGKTG